MSSERLYYTDSYLVEFDAVVREAEPQNDRWKIVLDRTAFYPTSGGQPFDIGHPWRGEGRRRVRPGGRHDRPSCRPRARDELARARPCRLGPALRSHAAAHRAASAVGGIRARDGRQDGQLSPRHVGFDDRSRQGTAGRSNREGRRRRQRGAVGRPRGVRQVRHCGRGGQAAAPKRSHTRRRAPHHRDHRITTCRRAAGRT